MTKNKLYSHSFREALVVIVLWLLALGWTVGYCYLRGYQHEPDSWVVRSGWAEAPEHFQQHWGIPDWVLIGVLLPWILCTVFTVVFCLFFMKDDDIGAETEEGENRGP